MAEHPHPDDFAQLRATVTTLQAEVIALRARANRTRHVALRRLWPLVLATLLVALVPLSILAATPFTDLTGGPHDGNIDAIFNAGITKGCDPPTYVNYCPSANVTREEMASFLARTAGLGGNPPVANAATASNATQLGGQPASAYLPASGDMTLRYAGSTALKSGGAGTLNTNGYGGAEITLAANTNTALIVPLPRPTAAFGRFLAAKSVRVCYTASTTAIGIIQTALYVSERGQLDENDLADNTTPRNATAATCYDVAMTDPPQAVAGMNYLYLGVKNDPGVARTLTLHSVALTVTPLAAGAAETPGVQP